MEIKFNVSEKVAKMFSLAVSISGKETDEVFEDLAKNYALDVLNSFQSKDEIESSKISEELTFAKSRKSKAETKIPLWARRLEQISSQIIKAFFVVEEGLVASRVKMRETFLKLNPDKDFFQFENNLNSMGTEKGNAHGHIFDFYGDKVCIAKNIENILLKYRHSFYDKESISKLDNSNLEEINNKSMGDDTMYELLESFKEYCQTPGIESGKAQSYCNAIQYLCDYLGVNYIDDRIVEQFHILEKEIYDYTEIRNDLLKFLSKRRQSSYLTGGFIRAALKYFYPFWDTYYL